MQTTKVEIGGACNLVLEVYGDGAHQDLCLEYTEHATDHYSSDTETSITIDRAKAIEIITLLTACYGL
jgi:hypothetical protein